MGGSVPAVLVVVVAGPWVVVDVAAPPGAVKTVVVTPPAAGLGAVGEVEEVTGAVVPVGVVCGGGETVPFVGVVVPVGPELGAPLLELTGGELWPVGSVTALSVVSGDAGDVPGSLAALVMGGLEPEPPEPAEPEGGEVGPLDAPEFSVVGLVKPLVGLVKLLVGLV